MVSADLLSANLLSPMVLAFALGALAKLLRSDLSLPEGLYTSLSIYLLFAIGLKGGVALSQTSPADVWLPAAGTVLLGVLTAGVAYLIGQSLGRFAKHDAAALAAHYGSVSAVTFIAAMTFVESQGLRPEGFLPALVAVLEIPAILLGLLLGRDKTGTVRMSDMVRELMTGRTVALLVGGLLIGLVSGSKGVEQVQPLFGDLFKGALTIFMLEMGLVSAQRFADLKRMALALGLYGIAVPLVNGTLGVLAGGMLGLSPAGSAVLGAMAGSASYIAAPAAVRLGIPKANPSIYLTASLAVTFPFNLAIGIPLYSALSLAIGRGG